MASNSSKRIYADYASTTPMRPEVVAAMEPWYANAYNASSLHAEGRRARAAIDDARHTIAQGIGARDGEIVFTSGGSESDNLALFGIARACRTRGKHIVASAIEHHAVLHALDVLRDDGYRITLVPVDRNGVVDEEAFAAALGPETILASVMLANNELGTIQPIARLAALARANGTFFHTDAIQAPGRMPLDVRALGVDVVSLAAHKFCGPKGTGALYVRTGTPLAATIVGGGQEAARRAGTENVAGIVGMAHALALATAEEAAESARLRALRDSFAARLAEAVPQALFVGTGAARLPHIASVAFPGTTSDAFVMGLDLAGVAASAGSACAAGAAEPSHVGRAVGLAPAALVGLVRFSFGRATTSEEIARLVDIVTSVARAQQRFTADEIA